MNILFCCAMKKLVVLSCCSQVEHIIRQYNKNRVSQDRVVLINVEEVGIEKTKVLLNRPLKWAFHNPAPLKLYFVLEGLDHHHPDGACLCIN